MSLAGQKPAQLIGNRQKLQTGATSQNFSRQIPQYFSARKVHNRTVPLCSNLNVATVGTVGNFGTKKMDWLENSNSSVNLAGQKLAQLIGNRQKLETAATSKIFSRQIPQYFSTRKVHNRTVPLCSEKCTIEPSPCVRLLSIFQPAKCTTEPSPCVPQDGGLIQGTDDCGEIWNGFLGNR